jgi:hypothetical protein
MSMMMRIGSGIAGPIFASSFGLGMRLGPDWTGLPFLISAALFLVGTSAVSLLTKEPLRKRDESRDDMDPTTSNPAQCEPAAELGLSS